MLTGLSKLLICCGWISGGYVQGTDSCEAIDLKSPASTCQNLPNFPAKLIGAIGGLGFKEKPVICGGEQKWAYSDKCFHLENKDWVSSDSMNSARHVAAAAQLKDGKLLVTGGSGRGSVEILTQQGWESKVPSLPVTIADHCMVTINSTTVMAIGGIQNDRESSKTFYFTLGKESWTEGPELKHKRHSQSCGKIKRNKESREMSIIVAGGYERAVVLSSVEILDEGSNEWKTGPELPFGIWLSQMVEDQNGGVVLIGGASLSTGYLDTLYQLKLGGQEAVWTKMDQKLKIGRHYHTAFLVPDNIVECS